MSKRIPKPKRGRPDSGRKRIHLSLAKETFPALTKIAKRYAGNKGVAVDELVRNAPTV